MLVLTRKLGEQIQISNGELTVTVIAIEGARVRLGISAPPAFPIAREDCRVVSPLADCLLNRCPQNSVPNCPWSEHQIGEE